MKSIKLLSLLLVVFAFNANASYGQSNLVFFTEQGEEFTLFVNGQRINEAPKARVTAIGISGDFAQVKVDFLDGSLIDLKKGMLVDANQEMTTMIKQNKKGKYVFKPVSSAPINNDDYTVTSASNTQRETTSTQSTQGQTVTVQSEQIEVNANTENDDQNSEQIGISITGGKDKTGLNINVNIDTNEEEEHTTTNRRSQNQQSNAALARVEGDRIILPDGRSLQWKYTKLHSLMGVEVEMKEPAGAQVSVAYESDPVYQSDIPFMYAEKDYKRNKSYFKLIVRESNGASWAVKLQHRNGNRILIDRLSNGGGVTEVTTQTVQTTTTSSGCYAMSNADFSTAMESISSKSFAEEKMTVAKQVLRSNCMTVDQIKEVIGIFTYEDDKLEFAKVAYPKAVDKSNYYQVNDTFTYSETIEQLDAFLKKQR
ncbi:MAG: DUF4476 domain-containing protein [Bacteroidota bacterium]